MARRRLPPRISRMFTQRLQYSRFKNTAKTSTDRSDDTVMSTFEKLFVTPAKIDYTTGFGQNVAESEIGRKSAGLFPKGFTVKGKTFTDHIIAQVPKTIKNNGISLTTELMNTHTMIESNYAPVDSLSKRGMLLWNDSDGTLAIYNKSWLQFEGNLAPKPFSGPITWYGDRGIKAGGAGHSATIDYWDIPTGGTAADFGDLGTGREDAAGTSSTLRGLVIGGEYSTNLYLSDIEYITISITGQSYTFGDLAEGKVRYAAATGNGVYGLCALGYVTDRHQTDAVHSNTIEYVTIDTTGNATDFGNRTLSTRMLASVSNDTYSLFAGGYANPTYYNTIDYVTIDTPGNATDFGDLSVARRELAGCSDETRGVFAGGYTGAAPYAVNTIEYVTIGTTGNTTDFGDLTIAKDGRGGCSNGTYGNFFGGYDYTNSYTTTQIDAITIDTTGNATDHGDLVAAQREITGFSGSPS